MFLHSLFIPFLHATHTTPADWLEHYAEAIVLGIGIVGLISVAIAVVWLQHTQPTIDPE